MRTNEDGFVMKGEAYLFRLADDLICCFESESDAVRYQTVLPKRLARYSLSVAEEKTKLLRFGRFARRDHQRLGEGSPGTFDFLGFTHYRGRSLFVPFSVGLTLLLTLSAATVVFAHEGVAANDTIKELLKKRLVILTKVHDLQIEAYKTSEVDYRQVIEAQKSMLIAQLDLCDTREERVKVQQEIVKVAKEMLQAMVKMAKAEVVGRVDVLKAEAYLVEAQIELERSRASK